MSLRWNLDKKVLCHDGHSNLHCHWPETPSIVLIIKPFNSNCTVSNWVKESQKGWKIDTINLSPVHLYIHHLSVCPVHLYVHSSICLSILDPFLHHSIHSSLSLSLSLSFQPSIIDLFLSLSMDWEKEGKRNIFSLFSLSVGPVCVGWTLRYVQHWCLRDFSPYLRSCQNSRWDGVRVWYYILLQGREKVHTIWNMTLLCHKRV